MKTREGKMGVPATVLLMFSVVLFAGCMFWLFSEASMINGSPGNVMFTPAPRQTADAKTMIQTVEDIKRMGCMVTPYNKQYSGGYENVTYQTLVVEASKARIAFTAMDFNGTSVLIVEASGRIIQWYPEA